jgi:NhaP-type Na+/H+ or K+/H+ antiporter
MQLTFIGWIALAGALLLALALSSAWIRRAPVSTAAIYLTVGCALGPWGLEVLRIDLTEASPWLERATEIALVLSLFIGGLRLRLPPTHRAWTPAYRLASFVMLGSIAGVATLAWLLFDLSPALAVLLGAILAPTDPVLAGAVTVGHANDRDPLRYALSGEAGLNDGAAFPFVVLGLLLLDPDLARSEITAWGVHKILWAIPVGLIVGFFLGRLVGSAAIHLRARNRDTAAPTDFLALALIALAYAIADAIGAWGFLAVFAAGIGLRHAEIRTVEDDPHPDAPPSSATHPPAETLVSPNVVTEREIAQPAVAAGVLVAEVFSFGDTVERVLEVFLVVIVGMSLATHWDARGVGLAILLMVLVRPPLCFLSLARAPLTPVQRGLVGWFGIRGIGSLYYLSYAFSQGLGGAAARELADLTLTAVATSIILHGVSAQPAMEWYERRARMQASKIQG